jgi:Calcineurin-like phosphoesterase
VWAVSGVTAARSRLLSRRRAIAAAALLLVAAALVVSRPPQGEAATVFSFGVAGDFGANSNTGSVLNAVQATGADAFFAIGDFSYNEVTPESAWCDFVKSRVGSSYPFELLAGNHEDNGPDGLVSNYATCLPDRLGVQGDYPREYYVDYPANNPLVRFVMISPQLTFPPGASPWSYGAGTAHYNWTASAIDGARSAGIPWVVVGMHMYCLSLVNFPCAAGSSIMNLLVSKKVDLYLQGHDHAYSRTKQLALNGSCTAIPTSSFNANCVADGNPASAYTAGNGTVLATVGSGGRPINAEHPELPQGPFFQSWMGSNFNATWGFLKVDVSDTQLSARFVRGSGGSFADSFTINKGGPPPPTSTSTTTTTTTAPGGGVTVTANADSFVQSDVPTAAHGADPALYVDSSPAKVTYLKFDTSALAGKTLAAATLRISTTSSSSSGSPDTQVVHPVSDSGWTESGLTYNTRPAVGAANLGSVSATASNTTYSIALNASQLQSLVGGQLTLALDSTGGSGDAFYVNSREAAANRPQLVLTAQ